VSQGTKVTEEEIDIWSEEKKSRPNALAKVQMLTCNVTALSQASIQAL
jgi:hypothetical protein